jgi:hypothetical protein
MVSIEGELSEETREGEIEQDEGYCTICYPTQLTINATQTLSIRLAPECLPTSC